MDWVEQSKGQCKHDKGQCRVRDSANSKEQSKTAVDHTLNIATTHFKTRTATRVQLHQGDTVGS